MLFLIRYGELTLKSRPVRKRFLSLLDENIRASLAARGIFFNLSVGWSRAHLRSDDPRAAQVLGRSFGVTSFSPATSLLFKDLDDLLGQARDFFAESVAGRSFAVRCRRTGRHPFRSPDVERELGQALLGVSAGVNLESPEITCYLELRGQEAWLFHEKMKGPGGLPVGSSARVLILLSGGYDSAVAAHMALKKGSPVDYLFFNLGGADHAARVLGVASILAHDWSGASRSVLYSVDFAGVVGEIRKKVKPGYWNLALKHSFYAGAERFALARGYPALVTGESLGQVSTQTLANLLALETTVSIPVLRPLLGLDKQEIVALARETGTATISEGMTEFCDLAAAHAVTATTPEKLQKNLADLDPLVLEKALDSVEAIPLPATLCEPDDLATTEVTDDAVVVDLRDPTQYEVWHWPGALLVGLEEIEAGAFHAENDRTYIFYCGQDLKSVDAARLLRQKGYRAFYFKGGTKGLRALQ